MTASAEDKLYEQRQREQRAGIWLPPVVLDAVQSFKTKTRSIRLADVLCERFDWLQPHMGFNFEFNEHGTYMLFDDSLRPRYVGKAIGETCWGRLQRHRIEKAGDPEWGFLSQPSGRVAFWRFYERRDQAFAAALEVWLYDALAESEFKPILLNGQRP